MVTGRGGGTMYSPQTPSKRKCVDIYNAVKWCFGLLFLTGLAVVFVYCALQFTKIRLEVRTSSGVVMGTARISATGRPFFSFEGLPYAQPPVGPLRFKGPELPPTPWNGTLRAWNPRPSCLTADERSLSSLVMDEDCLYLNVYTPALDGTAAVMVWLGGGDFSRHGETSRICRPDRLVDKDIVLVTVQYRRGVLGFLSTGDLVAPGNYGLKDQVAALRWVQDNIAAFGGDPHHVTIAGVGAGAASVGFHMLAPKSLDLFSGAIALGGSPLNPWAFNHDPLSTTQRLAEDITGMKFQDSDQLVAYLRKMPAERLVGWKAKSLWSEDLGLPMQNVPAPSLEPLTPWSFLSTPPWRMLEVHLTNEVPFLTGAGPTPPPTDAAVAALDRWFVESVAPALRLPTEDERRRAAAQLRSFYFGDDAITDSSKEDVRNMLTDLMLLEGVDSMARSVASLSLYPVYYYHVTDGQNGSLPAGVTRGQFTGDVLYSPNDEHQLDLTSEEAGTHDTWLILLAEFVKNRCSCSHPSAGGVSWPPYSPASPVYLEVGQNMSLQRDLLPARMDFWRACLPPKLTDTSDGE